MSILWCGGEDTSFPAGVIPTVDTTGTRFRGGYARCDLGIASNVSVAKSKAFVGGAITSCWLTFRVMIVNNPTVPTRMAGLGLSGTSKGLFVGFDGTTTLKMALWTYDGTTWTQLAQESGTSFTVTTIHKIDMQLVGPLATAVVNVYLDGALLVTFSGDVTVTGLTNYDCCVFSGSTSGDPVMSEFIVADEDTRSFPGQVTMALTGAGTTDNWTGSTFGNINGTSISDAAPMSSNTNAQESMFNITDMPSGSFVIKACKLEARTCKSVSPAVTKVQLGWADVSGTPGYTNAAVAVTTGYATYEQLDSINPITGVAFVQSEMNALQTSVKSAT